MTTALFSSFVAQTYSRSDFAYRISLLREFLEFVFFTTRTSHVGNESLDQFTAAGARPVSDIAFLRALPMPFFEVFTQDSLYTVLDKLSQEAKQLPTLSLTLPVVLSQSDREMIGAWVRTALGNDVLIEVDVDRTVAVGCRLVWNNQHHNYDFDHYLAKCSGTLRTQLGQHMLAGAAPR